MKNNKTIPEFLRDKAVKYSQGIIFWRVQLDNENNTIERANECVLNIERYTILFNEFKSMLDEYS